MLKDLKILLKVQLLRIFGINDILHSHDKKKKSTAILMAFCFLIVGATLAMYVGMVAYSLQMIGMTKLIPSYMLAITSVVILLFTIFKTNGMLFGANDYELLSALPILPKTIVASRFLTMYVNNLAFSALTMIPSTFVYVTFVKVSIWFYVMLILSVFLIPLIPMTVAAMIGAIITAVASRMKHKNLISIVFTMSATLGIMVLSFGSGNLKAKDYANLSFVLAKQLQKMYPLTSIYSKAMIENNGISFFIFAVLSIGIFYLFVRLTAWKYVEINSALKAHMTKSNYQLTQLSTKSPLKALYEKERKRFFSSSIYVLNAGIGYIMMLAMGIALLVMGAQRLENILNIPGFENVITSISPLIIASMVCINSTTSSSISLEGKQWDILLSLPIAPKTIFDSKILVNLTLSIPSAVLTSLMFAFALPFKGMELVWLFLTPMVYCLFSAVAGLSINLKLPKLKWDNEVDVIKQSAATFIFIVVGMISVAIPIAFVFLLRVISANWIFAVTTTLVGAITLLLYYHNMKLDLRKIA